MIESLASETGVGVWCRLTEARLSAPVSHTLSHVVLDAIIMFVTWVSRKGKNQSISPISVLQKKKKRKAGQESWGRGVGVGGRMKGLKLQPSGFSVCM